MGLSVPQTCHTPRPWGLLPNLPGLRERKPLLTAPPQASRQHISLERTLPEAGEGLRSRQAPRPQGREFSGIRGPAGTHPPGTHPQTPHTGDDTPSGTQRPVRGGRLREETRGSRRTWRGAHKDGPPQAARAGPPAQDRTGHTSPPPRPKGTPPPALQPPARPRGLRPSCCNTAASLLRGAGLLKPKGVYYAVGESGGGMRLAAYWTGAAVITLGRHLSPQQGASAR